MTPTPTLEQVPLAAIIEHTRNVRRDLGDLTELADSIREQGLLEPIVLAPGSIGKGEGLCPDCDRIIATNGGDLLLEHDHADLAGQVGGEHEEGAGLNCPGGGQPCADAYRLIAGHRRAAAAAIAGLDSLPAIIRFDLKTEADQILAMLVENLQRADLTPIEEADAYAQLTLFGYKPAQIAKKTGRSKAVVDRRLALTKLDKGVQDKVQSHELTLADAEALVEFAGDKAATKRLEKELGTRNWEWQLQKERDVKRNAAAAKKARTSLVRAGVKIVPRLTTEQINAGARYLGKWVMWDTVKVDAGEHAASCEHHAAVEPTSGDVQYVCLDPSGHPAKDDLDEDRGLTPEQATAAAGMRAVEEAFAADVETAAGVRREWIRQFTVGGKVLSADQRDLILRAALRFNVEFAFEVEVTRWIGWLDITVDYADATDWESREKVENELAFAQIERREPAVIWLCLLADQAQNQLESAWCWHHDWTDTRKWLLFLVDLGYDLTEWEAAQLDAHDQVEDEPAEAAV